MKHLTKFAITITFSLVSLSVRPSVAQASWGDFFLGVGAAAGVGAIINSSQRAEASRYAPVPPEQEYFRGIQDGMNGAKYDNPRNSPDYDRGFEEGVRRRQQNN